MRQRLLSDQSPFFDLIVFPLPLFPDLSPLVDPNIWSDIHIPFSRTPDTSLATNIHARYTSYKIGSSFPYTSHTSMPLQPFPRYDFLSHTKDYPHTLLKLSWLKIAIPIQFLLGVFTNPSLNPCLESQPFQIQTSVIQRLFPIQRDMSAPNPSLENFLSFLSLHTFGRSDLGWSCNIIGLIDRYCLSNEASWTLESWFFKWAVYVVPRTTPYFSQRRDFLSPWLLSHKFLGSTDTKLSHVLSDLAIKSESPSQWTPLKIGWV